MREVARVVSYRFGATFGRRWPTYLAVVLTVGVMGGLSMASIAAARRTQSSFTTFLASTNPSDLTIAVFPPGNGASSTGGYSASLTTAIRHLPDVTRVESWVQPFGLPLGPRGAPDVSTLSNVTVVGSVDGLSFNVDRPGVIEGTMADRTRPDQFVTTPAGAHFAGWHVGEVVPFGFYTARQIGSPGFATGKEIPTIRVDATLVGVVQFSDSVIQDQVDQYPTFALFTPALTDTLVARGMTFATYYAIQTAHGGQDVAAVERGFEHLIPPGATVQDHVTSLVAAKADRAIRPESIALGVFGIIALLATLAVGGQAIARTLRTGVADLDVLRAIGAGPAVVLNDGLVGTLGSMILGALLALGVATALSPFGPIGPVRSVYPDGGVAADWTVLGWGAVVILVTLGALSVAVGRRVVPHGRTGLRAPPVGRRGIPATLPRKPVCRRPRSPGCDSPSNPEPDDGPCRCVRCCSARPWPSLWWSPPSRSAAGCTPSSRALPSTAGTGLTRCSRRAAPMSHPRRSRSWTTTPRWPPTPM